MIRRGVRVALLLLVCPSFAGAQGTPLPLPTEPGGARPPVYTEPAPTQPLTAPLRSERPPATLVRPSTTPPAATTAPATTPEAEKAEGEKKAPTVKVPQLTSFPELLRGVGNSETLLRDK